MFGTIERTEDDIVCRDIGGATSSQRFRMGISAMAAIGAPSNTRELPVLAELRPLPAIAALTNAKLALTTLSCHTKLRVSAYDSPCIAQDLHDAKRTRTPHVFQLER